MKEKSSRNLEFQILFNFNFKLILIQNEKMKRRSNVDDTSSNKRQTVEYDATYKRIPSCKALLVAVISDESLKTKLRSAVKTMTDIRLYGSHDFYDHVLFAMTSKRNIIETKAQ